MIEIKHKITGEVLKVVEGDTLEEANLRGADLYGADLYGADLRGADLYGANLRGADLEETNLRGANLGWANLRGADLRGTDLEETNLRGADLEEVEGIYSFGSIGKRKRIGYAVKRKGCVMIQLGCFWGTEAEAIEAVSDKYGEDSLYVKQIKLAAEVLNNDLD